MSASAPMSPALSLWDRFNSEQSWLPFYIPFAFWSSALAYCRYHKMTYSKQYNLHTIHHAGAIILALISLYFFDDNIFNERITIFWSIPYFIVEIFDCILEMHLTYTLHAFFCLVLGIYNYNTPLHRLLRLNSKGALVETSSLLLYPVKKNKNPILFVCFAITYTACRIIWLPMIMREMLANGIKWNSPTILLLSGFYVLNLHWYRKIIMILINNGREAFGSGKSSGDRGTAKSSKNNGATKEK